MRTGIPLLGLAPAGSFIDCKTTRTVCAWSLPRSRRAPAQPGFPGFSTDQRGRGSRAGGGPQDRRRTAPAVPAVPQAPWRAAETPVPKARYRSCRYAVVTAGEPGNPLAELARLPLDTALRPGCFQVERVLRGFNLLHLDVLTAVYRPWPAGFDDPGRSVIPVRGAAAPFACDVLYPVSFFAHKRTLNGREGLRRCSQRCPRRTEAGPRHHDGNQWGSYSLRVHPLS